MSRHSLTSCERDPALVGDTVRLYGDLDRLPPALREATTANREAIAVHLARPEQSIAYDLVDIAVASG